MTMVSFLTLSDMYTKDNIISNDDDSLLMLWGDEYASKLDCTKNDVGTFIVKFGLLYESLSIIL